MPMFTCIDNSRTQGTLTAGNTYDVSTMRTHTTKFGVTRKEFFVTNDTGTKKWYDAARFVSVGATVSYTAVGPAPTPPTATASSKLKPDDLVRVREWDDLAREYGIEAGNIQCAGAFTPQMRKYCGFTYRIVYVLPEIYRSSSTGELVDALKLERMDESYPRIESYVITEEMVTKVVVEPIANKEKEVVKTVAKTTRGKMTLRTFLVEQGVDDALVDGLMEFRKANAVDDEVSERIIKKPGALYFGGKVWTQAIAALLGGNNILLEGEKATGKNVLAENLAFAFGRPMWDISMHVNIDASALIGAESFKNDEVVFRPGAVHNVATYGGFGVLDEVNMAKNEAVAVLHAVLDDRGVIDVPGYDRIHLNSASRFIATMNYGYVGTRELNEALVSRFVVIHVPSLDVNGMKKLMYSKFDNLNKTNLTYIIKVFFDLQEKAKNGEISTRSVDLRGIIDSIRMMDYGVSPLDAITCCVVNKCFDTYEKTKVQDVVNTLISKTWTRNDIFTDGLKEEPASGVSVDFSQVR